MTNPAVLILAVVLGLLGMLLFNALMLAIVGLPFVLLRGVARFHRKGRHVWALSLLLVQLSVITLYCCTLSPWNMGDPVCPDMPPGPAVGAGTAGVFMLLLWYGFIGAEIVSLAVLAANTLRGRSRLAILTLLGTLGFGYGGWLVFGCPGAPSLSSSPARPMKSPAPVKNRLPALSHPPPTPG